MSFLFQSRLTKNGQNHVIIAQKKYYQSLSEYNQKAHINKLQINRSIKEEINRKYSKINRDINQFVQIENKTRKRQKIIQQNTLKNAYEDQIRSK